MHTMQCMQDRYLPSSKILLHHFKPQISFHPFKMIFKILPSSFTANFIEKRVKYCSRTWFRDDLKGASQDFFLLKHTVKIRFRKFYLIAAVYCPSLAAILSSSRRPGRGTDWLACVAHPLDGRDIDLMVSRSQNPRFIFLPTSGRTV